MRLYTVLLYFLHRALHVSDYTLIHNQEHIQTVITTVENKLKLYIVAFCWTIIDRQVFSENKIWLHVPANITSLKK